ncbi:substrate-binding domain-containing protein [Bowmanella yangjiangensis]|uniref:Substrate-binding domain-containing protein n=1 Tax=Bowmanella yangjiangensis TaxID=2811230 RepID=A0ABS3CQI6_9ALTE|nr:substrate-binding domain-containing protein [Bowmanella yangjiangensis]MBN7818819.1 substrate-binding domain-containing protein [Bowmanella yangjiangensis]
MRKRLLPLLSGLMMLAAPAIAQTNSDTDFVAALAQAANANEVIINELQQDKLKGMGLTAAMAWHGASPWISAVNRGAKETFERHGVKVLVTTDAQYDPAKQVADIENIQALKPDMLLSLVIDGVSAKVGLQKAVDNGSGLVLLSNPIPGFVHGKEYAGIVSDDMQGMGNMAAEAVNQYLQGKGKVGVIFHDVNYFVTNTRDNAFLRALEAYPGIDIVARKGFVKEQDTSAIASAMMLRHPDIDVIYVAWDAAAEGVVEALRGDGFTQVKVVSHDLGVNNLLDMAQRGNMLASVSDRPYEIGATMARIAMLAKLGEQAPLFTLVPFDLVTRDNIKDVWQQAYQADVPRIINLALGD